MNFRLVLIFLCFSVAGFSQSVIPATPLVPPIDLSSNFAEYRTNHFHSGLDLRVANKTDWRVFSIWDGYVSRIRFNAGSYGRAVYITHNNGYTSVYGHLASFSPKIDSVITNWQYQNHQFSADIQLEPGRIKVAKGENIGVVGNSGYSFGAHLHFEIRNTESEKMLNPWMFFDLKDNYAPVFSELLVYAPASGFEFPFKADAYKVTRSKNNYSIAKTIMISDSSFFGFDVQDYQSNLYSRLLPFELEFFLDNELILQMKFDEYSLEDTKCCNSVFDHARGLDQKKQILLTRVTEGNKTGFYKINKTNGYVSLGDDKVHSVVVKAYDIERNVAILKFNIQKADKYYKDFECYSELSPKYYHEFVAENISVKLDTFSFSGKISLDDSFVKESVWNDNLIWTIGDKYFPLLKPYKITLKNVDSLRQNEIFAEMKKGAIVNAWRPQKDENNNYSLYMGKCGIFSLLIDSLPPKITKTNVINGSKNYKKEFTFEVVDNSTEIVEYNAFINDEWVLMIYDLKSDMFSIPISYNIFKKMKTLKVEFIDLAGNKTEKEYSF